MARAANRVGMVATATHDPIASTLLFDKLNVAPVTTTAAAHHTTTPTEIATTQCIALARGCLVARGVS